ncbi:MAG: hypothetical protein P4M00_23575 [Azospirillaceae bacterium]|nr:hypothetical protein [Azospirillaceae bacterium]
MSAVGGTGNCWLYKGASTKNASVRVPGVTMTGVMLKDVVEMISGVLA